MPHLDAAYRLARWLSGNGSEAEDVVQEAVLRAFHYFDGWRGDNGRVWLLTIVRNTHRTWARDRAQAWRHERAWEPDSMPDLADPLEAGPETTLIQAQDSTQLARLVAELPPDLREVIVLRDLQELPFREVAAITGSPVATVQSRLERARALLRANWVGP